jgi:hypothetical protein
MIRNSRARLGDVQCDSDGNCYTDGVLTAAPLTSSGSGIGNVTPAFVATPAATSSINWPVIGLAAAGTLLFIGLATGGGTRRR